MRLLCKERPLHDDWQYTVQTEASIIIKVLTQRDIWV